MSFKICVVGCGNIANNMHGPAYRKYVQSNEDVVLAACCDPNNDRTVAFKKKFGFLRHYTDMETMLSIEKPDTVCLLVPPDVTANLAVRVLELGYPLLLEKPPGVVKEETLHMMEIARKNNVANQVSFNRRHIPLIKKLKELLDEKVCTNTNYHIQCQFFRVGRLDPDFSTTAIHGIDLVKFIAGSNYYNVRFRYQELPHLGQGVSNIFLDCVFHSGATAQLSFCPTTGIVLERIIVNSVDYSFFVNLPIWGSIDTPGCIRLMHREKEELNISGETLVDSTEIFVTNGFYDVNKSFFDDIRNCRKPRDDIESGLQSVEIAECIRHRETEYNSP